MSALDTTMLTAMRAAIGELLPDLCAIYTAGSYVPDGEGGGSATIGTTGTAIACRLDAKQGREMLSGGAIQPFVTYMLSLPYDTTANPTDTVVHNSVSYAVKSINRNQSWKAVVRVELERI